MNDYGRQNNRGLTLVELLIVLGIIGLLGSISIPLAMRMGPTPTRTVETAARELFTVLKGARIYATTFNVETVVCYSIATPVDSLSENGGACLVLDAVALGRRLKRKELVKRDMDANAKIYVPVKNSMGRFAKLRGGTCVVSGECYAGQSVEVEAWLNFLDNRGMVAVAFFDPDSAEYIRPILYDPDNPGFIMAGLADGPLSDGMRIFYENLDGRFPAHVFLPSGGMSVSASARQRAQISVGLLPDADPNDRLTLDPEADGFQETLLTVELALYAAQGRIKVAP